MALSATALKTLIANNMKAADPTITKPEMVDAFADALAKAIVQHITTDGVVTIPASSIVTTGSAATQTGPSAPVNLQIK